MSDPFNPMRTALRQCRRYIYTAAAFSLAINILYLASPLYMLQVYNRVVTSGSESTLILLTVILLVAFACLAALDTVRLRILGRMGLRLEHLLAKEVFAASFRDVGNGARSQILRDFDVFRQFISSGSINPLLDLPWVPLYIGAAYLLHPIIGTFALACCILLLVLALANEFFLSKPLRDANIAASRSHSLAEMSFRNGEVIQAMGMLDGLFRRWGRDRYRYLERQSAASQRAAMVGGVIRFLRLSMQSVILGIGALLAVQRLTGSGSMFAGSFLLGRALQPIEQIVGAWRNIIAARVAYVRVRDALGGAELAGEMLALPRPEGQLSVENLHFALPGGNKFALRQISFRLEAGEALGIVGPSGAGKSTLVRALVGVLRPSAGTVRLDGADIQSWARGALGPYVGYLPQDVELFSDTVANNISRFTTGTDEDVIKAAEMAGVHQMILRLPDGYNTEVGEGGAVLSGGIRQRIGLARAVFGVPSLVVLDEPSSNLDADGDAALANCLVSLRAVRTTVIIVSHRPVTVGSVDKILFLKDGRVEAFGPRNEIAAKLAPTARTQQPATYEPAHG